MNIFLATFQAVAALLGIGILGFWIIGRRRIPENALSLLTSIAIDIALPFIVLSNILTQFHPRTFPDWWQLPLWWAGFVFISLLLALLSALLVKRQVRSEFSMSLVFQNGTFFPLIIIASIFGSNSILIVYLFLFLFLQPSMIFSTYSLFFKNKPPTASFSWKRVINPMLVCTLAGILIGLAGVKDYIPDFLLMIISLVGAMAVPLFMLILGGNVYNDFIGGISGNKKIYTREVILFTVIKNFIFPLIFLGLLILIHPGYYLAITIMLQAAVPPITAIPIFTQRCGGNRAITSQFIVASFVMAIISIPAMLYLFSRFFTAPS